jgi:hypothetical protein
MLAGSNEDSEQLEIPEVESCIFHELARMNAALCSDETYL